MNTKVAAAITSSVMLTSLLVGSTAFAADSAQTGHTWQRGMMAGNIMHGRVPGVIGTVSAINGTTLSVTPKVMPGKPSGTNTAVTYTVDASKASILKNGATSTLSSVAVGDTVSVQGTVSGTSVTATAIRDGMMRGPRGTNDQDKNGQHKNPVIVGNDQPVVGGTVTAINGTTLTLTNKSNVTYTVNAASTTVAKAGAQSSVSNIAVGDTLVVQGAVNGSSVTASSIIDQGNAQNGNNGMHAGFFGGMTNFFKHIFGF